MNFHSFIKTCLFLGLFAVGTAFLNIGTAHAVADVSVAVTDGGTTLGGATLTLTGPDGSTQTYTDDDDDGRFAFVLNNPGRYRMTIQTADGRTTSTTFNAPASGGVTIDADISGGSPRVSVNDTSSRSGNASLPGWSWGLFGTFGFTDWQGQFDDGSSVIEGDTGKLRKYGVGAGLRYTFPNYPLFIMSNIFYHAHSRSKDRFQSGASGLDLEMRERWKWQFMLGWTFMQRPRFAWALMVGFTLARVQMNIFSGNSLIQHEEEMQITPSFGTEMMWPVTNTDRVFFVLGATASIMNSISHNISGTNQFLRADNDLQWDTYAGIRVRF